MDKMKNPEKIVERLLGKNIKSPNVLSSPSKNDLDGDGIPNRKDCQPRNPMRQDRMLEKKVDGTGFRIVQPDGREIRLMQTKPGNFRIYAVDLARSLGLEPNPETLDFYFTGNPQIIYVNW